MALEWNDTCKTGHAGIDDQHRHLFDLTRQIAQADTADALKPLIMRLYKSTREHFELEEGLLRRAQFAGLLAHVEAHNQLLGRLNALCADVGKGEVHKAEIVKVMTDWGVNHVTQDDMQAAAYLVK